MRVGGFLEALATAYAGEPVAVELADFDAWGKASRRDGVYHIALDARLLTTERARLAHTFLHEVGHIVLGHVPEHDPKRQQVRAHLEASGAYARLLAIAVAQERRNEADADAWADRELGRILPAIEQHGLTFDALAILTMEE